AAAHGGPDLAEERLARSQRLADRAVAELEDVAEEHEAVGAVQRLEQRRAHLGLAQDGGASAPAEVQVGDDQPDRHAAACARRRATAETRTWEISASAMSRSRRLPSATLMPRPSCRSRSIARRAKRSGSRWARSASGLWTRLGSPCSGCAPRWARAMRQARAP